MEMGRTYSRMTDNRWTTRCTVATKEREEIKETIIQKMAKQHNKEGGNHLEQESNRQKTMEDTDGGLHPAVDEQSLGERSNKTATDKRQWKTLMEVYILQWMDKA